MTLTIKSRVLISREKNLERLSYKYKLYFNLIFTYAGQITL